MGFSVTVIATPLAHADALLSAAGVTRTGVTDPDGAGPVSAAEHGSHLVIWRNLRALPPTAEVDYDALSRIAPVLVLEVVDSAGAQVLRFHGEGAEHWRVAFGADNEGFLATRGEVPVDVYRLRDEARADWLARYPEDAEEEDEGLVGAYGSRIPGRIFEEITGLFYEDGPPEGLTRLSGDLPHRGRAARPWWRFW